MSNDPQSTATISDIHDPKLISERFVRHRGPVTGVAMIPETDWIATSGYDGALARFNTLVAGIRG